MPWIPRLPALAAAIRPARLAACAALLLLAACAPRERALHAPPRSETSRHADAVVVISIDGLPADIVGTGKMPELDALAAEGTHAAWMRPSYPTLTFPNHYTLVTGLRPDRHGIIHNNMYDPALGSFVSKESSALDSRWWRGEPIWTTLQKQGGKAATMFWPGSEVEIEGQRPYYLRPFDAAVTTGQRIDQLLAWFDLPPSRRPRLMLTYINEYDVASHAAGMHSAQATTALRTIDAALARLRRGLEARGMRARTDLLVISDHGMADVRRENLVLLEDTLDGRHYSAQWWGSLVGIEPVAGSEALVADAFVGRHPHYECWRKGSLPPAWHYGSHPRVPAIVCQTDVGWRVQSRRNAYQETPVKGEHGYSPDDPSMRAVFIADGPSFRTGATLPAFDNVHLYPLLAHLLGVKPAPSEGELSATQAALR